MKQKNMICFINRSSVDYDVRMRKYVQSCIETNTPYCVIAWDRLRSCSKLYPNEYQYKAYAPYGYGFKNILPLMGWVFYLLFMLIKLSRKYKIIHVCNMENCILVMPLRLFGKKIVFDIYDSYECDTETYLAKKCDALILPSNHRLEQIRVKCGELKRYIEIENVPVFQGKIEIKETFEFPKRIHLSYVGVLQRDIRGLENLLKMVDEDDRFILDIAGTGDGFDDVIKEYAKRNDSIKYYGKVDYLTALKLMNKSDFIVALYYLMEQSHKYASPNKYYESLYLSKPIITTKGTLVGDDVEFYNTGYVVGDTIQSLHDIFKDVHTSGFRQSYEIKKSNCGNRWSNTYSNYFAEIIKGKYLEMMHCLSGI